MSRARRAPRGGAAPQGPSPRPAWLPRRRSRAQANGTTVEWRGEGGAAAGGRGGLRRTPQFVGCGARRWVALDRGGLLAWCSALLAARAAAGAFVRAPRPSGSRLRGQAGRRLCSAGTRAPGRQPGACRGTPCTPAARLRGCARRPGGGGPAALPVGPGGPPVRHLLEPPHRLCARQLLPRALSARRSQLASRPAAAAPRPQPRPQPAAPAGRPLCDAGRGCGHPAPRVQQQQQQGEGARRGRSGALAGGAGAKGPPGRRSWCRCAALPCPALPVTQSPAASAHLLDPVGKVGAVGMNRQMSSPPWVGVGPHTPGRRARRAAALVHRPRQALAAARRSPPAPGQLGQRGQGQGRQRPRRRCSGSASSARQQSLPVASGAPATARTQLRRQVMPAAAQALSHIAGVPMR
jgi:hypothetical protein